MKYIRTKDKVLKVRKPFEDEYTDNTHIHCCEQPMVHKRDIIKSADAIEELCDTFVIVGNNWQQIVDLEIAKDNCDVTDIKTYGAIWTDKGLIYVAKMNEKGELELDMSKKLTPLQALKELKKRYGKNFSLNDDERCHVIETSLKEKEQQDNVLKVLKEVIKFATTLPYIEPNKDNGFDIMSGIEINIQRVIENKERKLLRQWILETCFPKELKALEIIKKKEVNVFIFLHSGDLETYNDMVEDNRKLTQEEYDLLKEILK